MTKEEMIQEILKKQEKEALIQQILAKQNNQGSESPSGNFIEEVHPDVSYVDRFKIKNFAANPEVSFQALQQAYPDFDLKKSGGELYLKKKNEKDYYALDPSGAGQYLKDPMEALRDLGDVTTDIAGGIGQGAITAGAGLVGAAGGPLGALGLGSAAGAGSGAVIEGLRQKIGQAIGLPQTELDTDQIKNAAIVGAVAPALLGTGGVAANELAQEAQKGLLSRLGSGVSRTVFPKIAEAASGIPADVTRNYMDIAPDIKRLEQEGITDLAEKAHQRIVQGLNDVKRPIGESLSQAIKSSGKSVDVTEIKKPFNDLLTDLGSGIQNKKGAANVEYLKSEVNDLFEGLPENISANEAWSLQDQLKGLSEVYKSNQGPTDRFSKSALTVDKNIMEAAREAGNNINIQLDKATDGLSGELKKQYGDVKKIQNDLKPYFKDSSTTYKTLSNLTTKNRKPLLEKLSKIDKDYGINVLDDAKLLQTLSTFENPSLEVISAGGATGTTRTIPAAAVGGYAGLKIGSALGGPIGGAAGLGLGAKLGSMAGSPAAIRKAADTARLLERLGGASIPGPAITPTLYNLSRDRE